MRLIYAAVIAAVALLPEAAIAQNIMANYYANTLVLSLPNGNIRRLQYNPDGTYRAVDQRGENRGTYTVDAVEGFAEADHVLCSNSTNAQGAAQRNCHPFWAHMVGDEWTETDGKNILKFRLEAGRN